MDEQIIFIYCIYVDLLNSPGISDDPPCKMNSAKIMTVAIVAALFFEGNFSKARLMLKSHRYIQNMLSESRLNRRMHEIDISIWQNISHAIARSFSESEENLEYLIDSMPVEVCMNVRNYRCRLLVANNLLDFARLKRNFIMALNYIHRS